MGYRQLTQRQRYQIEAGLQHQCSLRSIAQTIGCSSSTVSREIRRNSGANGYCPEQAQDFCADRRQQAHKASKRAWSLMIWVSRRLREYWSPEQIIGFMRRAGSRLISHQWIYELIYRDKATGGDLWRYCRQPGRRRYQRHLAKRAGLGRIPNRVGIEQRPSDVEKRHTLGHWEGDTVLHGHKQSGLVTLVERRSGYLLAERLPQLKARPTAEAIIRQFRPIRGAVRTLTLDNGFEFADHERISQVLSAGTYFCDPYCSSQRGTNENTNGLLRQYFPKGTDFRKISEKALRATVKQLNNRPRKRLGYRTPAEVFWGEYSGALDTGGAAVIT